ncbi:MAG: 1-deoxy-D-xylulose-5-phosphate reductoisomerase [Actinomycetes bacterium]|jgi:1-deoxy-D-xylulose-5-phosphate reductoisomerase|nr:1-deoxy-D-xylulose-5-phosphate reductoisomerase [Acidimicrobiia bacterium]
MSQVVVLGATGSIGSQALDVISHLGWSVDGLAANRPSRRLAELARRYPDTEIVVAAGDDAEARDFASRVDNPVAFGPDAVAEMASRPGRIVVNGIVGAAGLRATLAALHAGNRVALANKESLVAGGPLVMGALAEAGELIPVDSEHSALHQCLEGEDRGAVSRLVLTASGGPFRGRSRQELVSVSVEEALAHPTWRMGGRITVDSATLMNKGLEVIEAHHLFDVDLDRIDVVVHPQSIVHSAVEFVDGSLKAHIGHPDMRIPIQYALTYPKRVDGLGEPFSFVGRTLEFEEVDRQTFPAVDLAFDAARRGGTAPCVLNAADEVAVEAFLAGQIGFLAIVDVVAETLQRAAWEPELTSVDQVLAADAEARALASELVASARSSS